MMPRRRAVPAWLSLSLLASSVLVSACAHAPSKPIDGADEVRAAVAAANQAYAQALVRGDAHAMAAVFAQDGQLIPATEGGFVSGRAEIEAWQAKRLKARRYVEAVITTSQLGVSGDLAWETGTQRVVIQQGTTAPVTLTGRYLAVWQREADGRWRIRADLPVTDPVP